MPTIPVVREIFSEEEMMQFGAYIAHEIASPNLILALKGDLGAGKTTFMKGFISALTQTPPHLIQSPTFTYLQIYEGTSYNIYHFDLYRLSNKQQFNSAGFADYLEAGGICCLEWADRLGQQLADKAFFLEISYTNSTSRLCRLYQDKSL